MPKFNNNFDRPAYEAPQTDCSSHCFLSAGGQSNSEWSSTEELGRARSQKMIYSAFADKKVDGKSTVELARMAMGEDQGSSFRQIIQDAPP